MKVIRSFSLIMNGSNTKAPICESGFCGKSSRRMIVAADWIVLVYGVNQCLHLRRQSVRVGGF